MIDIKGRKPHDEWGEDGIRCRQWMAEDWSSDIILGEARGLGRWVYRTAQGEAPRKMRAKRGHLLKVVRRAQEA